MLVSRFIEDLSNTYLSQTHLGNVVVGENATLDDERKLKTLTALVDQGMQELFTKFSLGVADEDVTVTARYREPVELPDGAFSLIKVVNKDTGEEVPLNDPKTELDYELGTYEGLFVKTRSSDSYEVLGDIPDGRSITQLVFTYRTLPAAVKADRQLDLPAVYLEALRLFVALRVHMSTGTLGPNDTRIPTYQALYDKEIKKIEDKTDYVYQFEDDNRLWNRTFV